MITIIDYGIGNLESIKNALDRLKVASAISSSPAVLANADALILPGVGSANEGMKNLKKRKLDIALRTLVNNGKPILGICLGMQLLFDYSEEGNTRCLGIVSGSVKKYQLERKVPQVGWNDVRFVPPSADLFQDIPDYRYFYFVNSYYCIPKDKSIVTGVSTYGETFASVIVNENITATQFHPEKSGAIGLQLLKNFINISYGVA